MPRPISLLVFMVCMAGSAASAGVLDQHNDGPISGGTSIGVIGSAVDQSAAQTITVGIAGTLEHVEMYIYADGTISNPFILDIVPVADDLPDTSMILATSTFTPQPSGLQWVSFDFNAAHLAIAQGQRLALVLHSAQHLDQGQLVVEGTPDVYPGQSFVRMFSNPWSEIDNYDLSFRTFVNPGAGACYANCDNSTIPPILNVNDFVCFLNRFADGEAAANCDGSTTPPVLNVNDFVCFQTRFAQGCP